MFLIRPKITIVKDLLCEAVLFMGSMDIDCLLVSREQHHPDPFGFTSNLHSNHNIFLSACNFLFFCITFRSGDSNVNSRRLITVIRIDLCACVTSHAWSKAFSREDQQNQLKVFKFKVYKFISLLRCQIYYTTSRYTTSATSISCHKLTPFKPSPPLIHLFYYNRLI